MFGLGDRVSKRSVTANLSEDNGLLDTGEFRSALDRVIRSQNLSEEDRSTAKTFLEAWGRSPTGDDY